MNRLLKRAQQGDDEAFIKLFEQHKQALWRTAYAILHNEADAEDALQETIIKAWKGIPRFSRRSSIGTWITRILLNTCYDALRSQKHKGADSSYLESDEYFEDEGAHSIENGYLPNHEGEIEIEDAMDKLSNDDRLLLTLFYLNNYSTREIASILSISDGAARTRLSRARERFRSIYGTKQDVKAEVES
ncbi:MAG: RNA polymerase sigma factor [Eggerthellaceae bacterium]|nr:RNA polymerase sigma factor [Eggerthellaceae bacterium]